MQNTAIHFMKRTYKIEKKTKRCEKDEEIKTVKDVRL